MGLTEEGELGRNLASGQDYRLQQLAQILQRVRPDVIVLNEFDYDPSNDAARLFNEQYLAQSRNDQTAIEYPYSFRGPVNTGLDSGLDLDSNGISGEPQDAWGYGAFPGQYGMLVLSRYPIRQERSRTFQFFPRASLPGAQRPFNPDGTGFQSDDTWERLRLSSKSHWDLLLEIAGQDLHLLVHHPTPSVFDGPEDRNGKRNHDENRFWLEYLDPSAKNYIVDDKGKTGGLDQSASFVIAGDLNADPVDGDSAPGAIKQLLESPLIDSNCIPQSSGGREASATQGGKNQQHKGDPARDTSDFNDEFTGNLRIDYVLPSNNITVRGCGVFWPAAGDEGHELVDLSDHRLVWLDISL